MISVPKTGDDRNCSLYWIRNKFSGEAYVGISVVPKKRFQRHKFDALRKDVSKQSQTHIHRALRAYGPENFDWGVLAVFDTVKLAKAAEIEAVAAGLGDYNLTPGGDGNTDMKPETRAKISAVHKGKLVSEETRKRMSDAQKGHAVSDEARLNMSLAHVGKPGHLHTPETKAKIAAAQTGRTSPQKGTARPGHSIAMAAYWERRRAEEGPEIKGPPVSQETRDKLSATSTGRLHTDATKIKMRASWVVRKANKLIDIQEDDVS